LGLRFDYLDGRDGAQVANEAASEFGLSGRTYIVTGAGRGLGRAMALAIAAADGPQDGIVHAAGTQYRAPATAVTVAAWRDLMAIHLDAPFFLSTALHRDQLRDGQPGTHVRSRSNGPRRARA
jgi:NAD(P)-dependent dehydrogenase (short-subunit alcohol dehydrogenase family)